MALIPGYEYDIFISYAHVDNAAFPGQTDGWIEQFYQNLNLLLAKRFGRMDLIKIWWDNKKLDGSVLFDQSIETGIKKSAILICLNSPGYIASSYCQQELDTFYKKAQQEKYGLKIGDRSRILNVLLNNIPHDQWLPELSGTSGFPFHGAKEASEFGDPLDTMSVDFRTQMQHVRDAVWNLLNDFPKVEAAGVAQVVDENKKDEFTIYLGEVADTLRSPRKRIIVELEKQGYNVVTGVPPPDEAAAHEKATKDALQKAHLSIHLLDEFPGREIIGAPEISYTQKQTELAMQSNKSKMIWVPAEMDFTTIEDGKYKTFLQELETGKEKSGAYEYVRGSRSMLSQEIMDYAKLLKQRQSSGKTEKGKVSVLLDTHFNDQIYALELSRTLIENQIQPFINPQEDDPRKNINLLGERISQVRKMIFFYGSVSKEWVLERMSAALQLIIVHNYPIEDFYIYLAPPRKQANEISLNQRFLKVNVIDSSNSNVPDQLTLQNFLNNLKTVSA